MRTAGLEDESADPSRALAWPDCVNVRDLGGWETADGDLTRFGVVIRGDDASRLTDAGVRALVEHGVRTVLDLRSAAEILRAPGPFRGGGDARVAYRNVPLFDETDRAGLEAVVTAPTQLDVYLLVLRRFSRSVGDAVTAIAAAEGGVFVHCVSGRDRTGLVAALLLALAGVPTRAIVRDYQESEACVAPLIEQRLAVVGNAAARERIRRKTVCEPRTILAVLAALEDEYGGPESYLTRTAGVSPADVAALRTRLRAREARAARS